ncbi:4Fe-4S dicluster domain-containing protein [Methanococcus voltae]|jgi:carbon-monoxide dehydrogenase iron sulfur subunit|uniref:4Fe-4S ferredoxin iron-sulfur binding domain protein n=1 Tax=Methanococcus voltae (strain ATCC BAA-1334 / A3) TaxID=456320 RepID=D7DUC0_METV3|nr:4Fe-4S dicluster domain-containing protein [Methanococcus voltae]MCS3900530.1 carbon-monoxide dehydrogenase iron sulfur subunit [Methanococcus voltae]
MKKIVMLDSKSCDNCGDCMKACSEVHGVSRISILDYQGEYFPVVCQHCASAPCGEICPVNAIDVNNGVVHLNEELCIGCGLCALACPFGAIFINEKTAHKCDLCIEENDECACIKACSKRCLEVVDVEDIVLSKKLKNLPNLASITKPGSKAGKSKNKSLMSLITSSSRVNNP